MKKPIGYKPVNYFQNKQYALYCADSMRKSGKFNAKVIKENDGNA